MAVTIDGTNGITAPNVFGKNVIINGNFAINQRGVSGTVTLSAGAYGHDRFKAGAGGCTYTFATSQNVTTLTITAGTLIQVIEGANLLTDTYTLTFTGTAQGKIGAGSFGASGITGSVTGGTNLNVEFNTGTVSLVQLERGSVATPFEFRSIGQELGLCQRYFRRISSGNAGTGGIIGVGAQNQTTSAYAYVSISPPMRATPTIAINQLIVSDSVTFDAAASVGSITGTQDSIFLNLNYAATGAQFRPISLRAVSTDVSGRFDMNSEL